MSKIIQGFKNFILRGNAVELAVGVVIGAAFNTMIQAIVKDLLTPLIGAIARVPDFSVLNFTINSSKFMIGEFINTTISFLLVAVAVYFFVVLPMNAIMSKKAKAGQIPTFKKCPECLSDIPYEAKRCSHCSQPIK
jgi:large conductance mechanosensitive channel